MLDRAYDKFKLKYFSCLNFSALVLLTSFTLPLYAFAENQTNIQSKQANMQEAQAARLLDNFIMQNKAFKVNFTQTTQKSQSNIGNQSSKITLKQKIKKGQLTFLAPNRFIWQYNFPEQEIIQSDGETVTLWNKSINQIIQKQAKTILQNSPIELIFNGAWKQQFDIELDTNSNKDTLEITSDKIDTTIILKPKQSDAMYAGIYLHFYQQQLKVLSFNTRAGFRSYFEFTEFKAHTLKANDFKFKQELLEQIEAKS